MLRATGHQKPPRTAKTFCFWQRGEVSRGGLEPPTSTLCSVQCARMSEPNSGTQEELPPIRRLSRIRGHQTRVSGSPVSRTGYGSSRDRLQRRWTITVSGSAWGTALYIQLGTTGYTRDMTKKLIDVDEDKLNEVRSLLGVATAKATVNGALDEVIALAARRRALLDYATVAGSADLADDEKRRAAWA